MPVKSAMPSQLSRNGALVAPIDGQAFDSDIGIVLDVDDRVLVGAAARWNPISIDNQRRPHPGTR